MYKFILSFLCILPATASFKAPSQVIPLQFGQAQATVIFETTGEDIKKAKPHCDCTKVYLTGTTLTAEVDTHTFDRDVEKTITAETKEGKKITLRMQFQVPQAMQLSARSLVWKCGEAPIPKVLKIHLPKGSPITHISDASLNGDAFDYAPKVVKRGQEYNVTVTPHSTGKPTLNRLVLTTNATDPRYHRQIIYLQVKK